MTKVNQITALQNKIDTLYTAYLQVGQAKSTISEMKGSQKRFEDLKKIQDELFAEMTTLSDEMDAM